MYFSYLKTYPALINIKLYLFLRSFKHRHMLFNINKFHLYYIIQSIFYPFISNSIKLSCLMQFYVLVANNSENIGLLVFQFFKCKHISILIYIVIV
jgi:hypothetical protein